MRGALVHAGRLAHAGLACAGHVGTLGGQGTLAHAMDVITYGTGRASQGDMVFRNSVVVWVRGRGRLRILDDSDLI